MRVLMVCLGNICRSPLAAAAFAREAARAGLAVEVDSAGMSGWHEGEPPDQRGVAAAARRGLDIAGARARAVTGEDFHRFDLILAMDRRNLAGLEARRPAGARARLGLLLDHAPEQPAREVPDPYYGEAADFDRVLDLVEIAAAGLARTLAGRH